MILRYVVAMQSPDPSERGSSLVHSALVEQSPSSSMSGTTLDLYMSFAVSRMLWAPAPALLSVCLSVCLPYLARSTTL